VKLLNVVEVHTNNAVKSNILSIVCIVCCAVTWIMQSQVS